MKFFQNTAPFLLLVIYLFSTTVTSELLKLPVLVEHYYDHRDENKNIRVISFLAMHYYFEDDTDKDAEKDNQLPFKSVCYCAAGSCISLPPPLFLVVLPKREKENNQSFGIRKYLFLNSQYLAAIWQPPRHY